MASIEISRDIIAAHDADRLRPVRIWLYSIVGLILVMVMVGGITRLTNSGLSMTSWQPISGVIPPLNAAAWQAEFNNYKTIPQYHVLNQGMTLAAFKSIFWWEWSHRLLGRLIGLAFFVPFLVFLFQRRFTWGLATPLAVLFVLGGLQGLLGWWMVTSGLESRIEVSQYRLAAHLCAALVLFMAVIWVARSLEPRTRSEAAARTSRWPIVILLVLIFFQIGAGAFVAGLRAGYLYNTWPLMDGSWIPSGMGILAPLWRNVFENPLTVQFDHRCIAYIVVLYVAFLIWRQARNGGFGGVNGWLPRIGVLVLVQVGLGIATLLSVVALPFAAGHQVMAFMLEGTVIAYLADITKVQRAR